jgi:uncharacterized protein YdiU (UPF0061 family)
MKRGNILKIELMCLHKTNKNIRDLYRGMNEFKRAYQPRSNLVKQENGDLLADSHNNLNSWKNYYSQVLNVYTVSEVGQVKIHRAEPLVLGPSHLEFQIVIVKVKKYKSPGSEKILAQLHL